MAEDVRRLMRHALAIVTLLMLAGCLGGTPTDDERVSEPEPEPEAPTPATTAAAPAWQPGTWWRWEVHGRDFEAFELTTVVADVAGDEALIGSPDRAESLGAHILHVPPQGPVAVPEMRWYIHGDDVALIEFPLEDGKTWTGSLEGASLTFTATAEDRGGRAVYSVNSTYTESEGQGPRYIYDPAIGMFSEFHLHYGGTTPFSSARVIDAGQGHEGEIGVPWAQDKLLAGHGGPSPDVPRAAFTSPMEKEWLVMACYLGGSTGSYGITFVTPSPNEDPLRCSHENSQPGFDGTVEWMWRSSLPGEWNVLFDVVGDGFATAEVIGVFEDVCRLGETDSEAPACRSLM